MYKARIKQLENKIKNLEEKNQEIELTYGMNKTYRKNEMLIKEYEVVIDYYNDLMQKLKGMKTNE